MKETKPCPKRNLPPRRLAKLFIAKVTALLLDLGAKPTDFDFLLTTKAGPLRIYPAENLAVGLGTCLQLASMILKLPGNSWPAIHSAANGITISSTAGAWNPPSWNSIINSEKSSDSRPRFHRGGYVSTKRKPSWHSQSATRRNFQTLIKAIQAGDVALMECEMASTGETAAVICAAVEVSSGQCRVLPVRHDVSTTTPTSSSTRQSPKADSTAKTRFGNDCRGRNAGDRGGLSWLTLNPVRNSMLPT